MNSFNKRKLDLLLDIAKVSNTIDQDVDSYVLSRYEPNKKKRELLKQIHSKYEDKLYKLTNKMNKKYAR